MGKRRMPKIFHELRAEGLDRTYLWNPSPKKRLQNLFPKCHSSKSMMSLTGADDPRSCFHADRQRGTAVSILSMAKSSSQKLWGLTSGRFSTRIVASFWSRFFFWEGWWTVLFDGQYSSIWLDIEGGTAKTWGTAKTCQNSSCCRFNVYIYIYY